MDNTLDQAISAIRAGDKTTGRSLLVPFLNANPASELAWLWMSAATDDLTEKRRCFEEVLRINPANPKAQQALAQLGPDDDGPPLEAMVSPVPGRSAQAGGIAPAMSPSPIKPEISYHHDDQVTVTSTRAILRASTYPMSNIASVSMQVVYPSHTLGIILILLGVLGGLCLFSKDTMAFGAVGVVLLIAGIIVVATNRTKYAVRIGSSSGETNALISPDKAYIERVVGAINQAVVERG